MEENKEKLGSRVRNYIFTINNPPQELTKETLLQYIVARYKCNYVIVAHEFGKEKGTEHLQGYISLKNNTYFLHLKKYIESCSNKSIWLHEAYGNEQDNEIYLTKDGDYVEYGNSKMTTSQLQCDLIDDILNGMHLIDLIKKYSSFAMHHYRDFKQMYNDIKATQNEYEQLQRDKAKINTIEQELGVKIELE